MRYNIFVDNEADFSYCRMGNGLRFIIDNFDILTICYSDSRPSKILSTDPDIIVKFRRKVLRRIAEYAYDVGGY